MLIRNIQFLQAYLEQVSILYSKISILNNRIS